MNPELIPDTLKLNRDQLTATRDVLAARIQGGLREPGQEIKALPAFLRTPAPGLEGRALVVDLGGSNLRAAIVALQGGQAQIVEQKAKELPSKLRSVDVSVEEFFGFQADLAAALLPDARGLPVGYCFSYPSESTPNGDSILLRWTKEIKAQEVIGRHVGADLLKAMDRRGLKPRGIRVLNDTVATLLGGAFQAGHGISPERMVGLIAGTGTNMAGFFDARYIGKLTSGWQGSMAVNLESGNFQPPHLSQWDDQVDQGTADPGRQRFEKAVSGHYLPQLYRAAMDEHHPLQTYDDSELIDKLRDDQSAGVAGAVAAAILDRSADLVAAGIAGVLACSKDSTGAIGLYAEGSLFWKAKGYCDRVKSTLTSLLPQLAEVRIERVNHANLIGAAIAALE